MSKDESSKTDRLQSRETMLLNLIPRQHSADVTILWDRRCPECNLNWCLFPPVHIHGLPMVRCIECKCVYDEATGSEVNEAETPESRD